MTPRFHRPLALAAAVLAVGCIHEVAPPDQLDEIDLADKGEETKEIPWGSRDDPNIFANDLTYTFEGLPAQGSTQTPPWPSSYWPVYQDSLNDKWAGASSLSPAAKYGQAFGVSGVEDAVSRFHGIDSQSHRTKCTEQSQCKSELGESCAKRDGATEGYCIPTWFGICHAWAPAALLHPEAQKPVTVNGVEFRVNDIKALVTLVHNQTVNKFASRRCEGDVPGSDNTKIEYDEYGRPKNGDCIDTNPGTFHLLLTNFLGMRRQGFVYDRTYNYEVWNQPIAAYRITQQTEIDGLRANQLVGVTTAGGTTTNHDGQTVTRDEWKHFPAVSVPAGSSATVRMTGTGDADLYVKLGAQPTSSSYDCRPYANGSDETCEVNVPAGGGQLFVSVHGYTEATVDVAITAGGSVPTSYLFNERATRFFDVKLEVDYISESSSSTDGPLVPRASQYTHTDRYHYVLEVDAQNRIVGGEWLDSSKRAHPDFVWLPIRSSQQAVAGGKIKYNDVMSLLNQSLDNEGGGGSGRDVEQNESGTVNKGQLVHFGPFNVAEASSLIATMTGSGDADLYVRKGAAPTLTSYDCRPYKSGSAESCTVDGPGNIFVAVNGYAASSTFDLNIKFKEPGAGGGGGGGGGTPPPPPSTHLNVSGDVALDEMKFFELTVAAGQEVVVRTQAPKDVDLYLQFGRRPTTDDYVAIAYTSSGNEQVAYKASAAGTLHIGVYGYQASSFTLTTANQ